MAVGELLRHWRGVRRLSQLALALEAGTTTRHLSFIETGRSQPSRAMVMRLARVLDVPIRERNQLLLAAGYAPVYAETGLAAEDAALVAAALTRMLESHEPYPALVMDRHCNILDRNHAAHALFGWLLREHAQGGPGNLIRNFFDPDRLRPYVTNWDEAANALLQRVHREAIGGAPDAETTELLDEVLAYPGVPRPDLTRPLLPVIPVTFSRDGRTFSYFSAVTTLGTPQDALLQELRVESLHPADEETAVRPTP
ncbi:MAG TPA: helix-turn-helix transcriptional regulator [Methylomirabilota bacterium]|nr:helix-turn-helix transcriptional regulator [Methylomirabilota bacterium]